jgi:hypothetical protein
MRNLIFIILLIIGLLLIISADSVHTGSIRENGRIGLDMFFKGLLFVGIAFIVLLVFKSKKG